MGGQKAKTWLEKAGNSASPQNSVRNWFLFFFLIVRFLRDFLLSSWLQSAESLHECSSSDFVAGGVWVQFLNSYFNGR